MQAEETSLCQRRPFRLYHSLGCLVTFGAAFPSSTVIGPTMQWMLLSFAYQISVIDLI